MFGVCKSFTRSKLRSPSPCRRLRRVAALPTPPCPSRDRQIPRLEQFATKRVLFLGTNLGHSALIHNPPSRSSNVILWRRSTGGACLFLLAVLGCLQASAQQKPASPLDEFERRFAAAKSAKEAGDLPAAAAASEKIVALGLREMGKLRLFEAAYPEAARFSHRSLEFEDVADAQDRKST